MSLIVGRKLVEELSKGKSLDAVLKKLGLKLGMAMHVAKCPGIREEMRWRRKLVRLQGRLLAERALPAAVEGLCALLKDKAPAVRLKSVLTVLAVTGLEAAPVQGRKEATAKAEEPEREPTAEEKELALAVAEVMDKKRLKQAMGEWPEKGGK